MSVLLDLVAQTVSSAFGTGTTIPLANAAMIQGVTYLTYASAGANGGDAVIYSILDSSNSEIGTATYTSSNTTLTSRTPTKSTNGNATINGSSAAVIMATIRAEDLPQLGAANTFTAKQSATAFLPTAGAGTAWGLDFQKSTMSIGPSSFALITAGAGAIIITDGSVTGDTAMYLTGGSAVSLIGQSIGTSFTTSSTPGSSKYSVAYFATSTSYAVFNGSTGNTVQFFVATISARPTL